MKAFLHELLRQRKIHKLRKPTPVASRRRFFVQGAAMVAASGALIGSRLRTATARVVEKYLPVIRPPSASLDDAEFRSKCIGCGLCGTVCENGCIKFFGIDEPLHGALTPYLDVRRRSCTLCMRCTDICPTGALSTIEDDPEAIKEQVRMGTAVVDPDRCLSYLGRVCGYCYDACPLPLVAIRLSPPAKPVVLTDGCVGCGRCVELCPQNPTAIDIWRDLPALDEGAA